MERRPVEYFRKPHGSNGETSLDLAPDIMTKEAFKELDAEQEKFLSEVSTLFPIEEGDEDLKNDVSDYINVRFQKGDRQFAAGGMPQRYYGPPVIRPQDDYRLGNTNTCAERVLLDAVDRAHQTLANITVFRGENVESVPLVGSNIKDARKLQTLQERGGRSDRDKKSVMRHMVVLCAYCREGLCYHNPTAMVIAPPGILRQGKNTEKLRAFMIYPEDDLLSKDDPLLQKLKASGNSRLVEARIMQKEFFRRMAKRYAWTYEDSKLLIDANRDIEQFPPTKNTFVLIRGRTITNGYIEEHGEIDPPPEHYRYLQYSRNDVEFRFVQEVLEVPRLPDDTHKRGSSQALHVFLELGRDPTTRHTKLLLPNADTRQRMIERYPKSFFLTRMDDEIVKAPTLLLLPNRYKRFDKGPGRV